MVAQISDPVRLGAGSATPGTTVAITLASMAPAGTAIVAFGSSAGGDLVSVTDDQGNAPYTVGVHAAAPVGGRLNKAWMFPLVNALPIGAVVTATWSGSGNLKQLILYSIGNVVAFDREAGKNDCDIGGDPDIITGLVTCNDKEITQPSGNQMQATNELVLFASIVVGGATDDYREDANLSTDPAGSIIGAVVLRTGWMRPPNINTILLTETLGTARSWGSVSITFAGAPLPPELLRAERFTLRRGSIFHRTPVPVEKGYQYPITITNAGTIVAFTTMDALNMTILRAGADTTKMTSAPSFYDAEIALLAPRFKHLTNIKNRDIVDLTNNLSVPPPDPALFKQEVKAYLTRYIGRIAWITAENEVDNGNNYSRQITPGVRASDAEIADRSLSQQIATNTTISWVAHMKLADEAVKEWNADNPTAVPVKFSPGGISSSGLKEGFWKYLFDEGQLTRADTYAAFAFAGVQEDGARASDLPTVLNPTKPIFESNTSAYLHTLQVQAMMNSFTLIGCKTFSCHLFGRLADMTEGLEALRWAWQHSGAAAVVADAIGIKDSNVGAIAGVANVGMFGPSLVSFFGAVEKIGDNADPIANADGSLNALGIILRDAMARWPS